MPWVGRVDVLRMLPGHLGDVLANEQAVEVGVEAVTDDGDGVLPGEARPRRQPVDECDDPSRRLATQFKEERVAAAVACDRQQGAPRPDDLHPLPVLTDERAKAVLAAITAARAVRSLNAMISPSGPGGTRTE